MKIELNQEIIVVGISNSARYSTPVHKGIVNKIGRKWFYVTTEDEYTGRDNKFSLEDGVCDGKGYSPDWVVYESEQARYEINELPKLIKEIINSIGELSYQELTKILNLIKL